MAGQIHDRGTYVEYLDKDIRFAGTGGIEVADNVEVYDDFVGDTLDANLWTATAATGATAFAIAVAAGGTIAGVSGDDDNEVSEIAGEIIHLPSQGIAFEARVKLSAITAVGAYIGLTDAKTEGGTALPFGLVTATLTSTATDAVGFLFDTDATTDEWFAVGVANDVDATHATLGVAPTAATYQRFRVEVDTSGNAVLKIMDDAQPGSVLFQKYLAGAVTAGTLLCPYIGVGTRTAGSARTMTADYIRCRTLGRA